MVDDKDKKHKNKQAGCPELNDKTLSQRQRKTLRRQIIPETSCRRNEIVDVDTV